VTSKTTLTKQVRAFDVDAVRLSLEESPDLLGARDERGRTWLHLCCGVDVRDRTDRGPSLTLANGGSGAGGAP